MIAFLALLPLRRRAFLGLELGRSLAHEGGSVIVSLPPELTKNGEPWTVPVPERLLPLLERYLGEARPWLMRRGGQAHGMVWVDDRGRTYHPVHFAQRITRLTERLTGVKVPPHFFRDAAATTLARTSPEAARLMRPLLAHSSYGIAERHYNHALTIEAGRDYAALLRNLGQSPP